MASVPPLQNPVNCERHFAPVCKMNCLCQFGVQCPCCGPPSSVSLRILASAAFRKFLLGRRMSSRFVAGFVSRTPERSPALSAQGLAVTLDSLGENVITPDQARQSAQMYHWLLDLSPSKLDANVSLKLTQMGMDLSPGLAARLFPVWSTTPSASLLRPRRHGGFRLHSGHHRPGSPVTCEARIPRPRRHRDSGLSTPQRRRHRDSPRRPHPHSTLQGRVSRAAELAFPDKTDVDGTSSP